MRSAMSATTPKASATSDEPDLHRPDNCPRAGAGGTEVASRASLRLLQRGISPDAVASERASLVRSEAVDSVRRGSHVPLSLRSLGSGGARTP